MPTPQHGGKKLSIVSDIFSLQSKHSQNFGKNLSTVTLHSLSIIVRRPWFIIVTRPLSEKARFEIQDNFEVTM